MHPDTEKDLLRTKRRRKSPESSAAPTSRGPLYLCWLQGAGGFTHSRFAYVNCELSEHAGSTYRPQERGISRVLQSAQPVIRLTSDVQWKLNPLRRQILGGANGTNLGAGASHTRPNPCEEGILSVQAISWVIDHSKQRLGSLVVLLMIANHARSDGTGAWPSIATLAKEARMSERQVQYCLRKLAKSGELRVKAEAGPHGTNLYSIPGVQIMHREGAKSYAEGCKIASESVRKTAPNPSLTVLKDKYGPYVITSERQRRYLSPDELEDFEWGR